MKMERVEMEMLVRQKSAAARSVLQLVVHAGAHNTSRLELMAELPLWELMFELGPAVFEQVCRTSKTLKARVCENPVFWRQLFYAVFGFVLPNDLSVGGTGVALNVKTTIARGFTFKTEANTRRLQNFNKLPRVSMFHTMRKAAMFIFRHGRTAARESTPAIWIIDLKMVGVNPPQQPQKLYVTQSSVLEIWNVRVSHDDKKIAAYIVDENQNGIIHVWGGSNFEASHQWTAKWFQKNWTLGSTFIDFHPTKPWVLIGAQGHGVLVADWDNPNKELAVFIPYTLPDRAERISSAAPSVGVWNVGVSSFYTWVNDKRVEQSGRVDLYNSENTLVKQFSAGGNNVEIGYSTVSYNGENVAAHSFYTKRDGTMVNRLYFWNTGETHPQPIITEWARIEGPYSMYFSPDGRWLVERFRGRRHVDVYSVKTGQLIKSLTDYTAESAEFSHDSQFLVTSGEFGISLIPTKYWEE